MKVSHILLSFLVAGGVFVLAGVVALAFFHAAREGAMTTGGAAAAIALVAGIVMTRRASAPADGEIQCDEVSPPSPRRPLASAAAGQQAFVEPGLGPPAPPPLPETEGLEVPPLPPTEGKLIMPARAGLSPGTIAILTVVGLLIAAGVWYPTLERHLREAQAARDARVMPLRKALAMVKNWGDFECPEEHDKRFDYCSFTVMGTVSQYGALHGDTTAWQDRKALLGVSGVLCSVYDVIKDDPATPEQFEAMKKAVAAQDEPFRAARQALQAHIEEVQGHPLPYSERVGP